MRKQKLNSYICLASTICNSKAMTSVMEDEIYHTTHTLFTINIAWKIIPLRNKFQFYGMFPKRYLNCFKKNCLLNILWFIMYIILLITCCESTHASINQVCSIHIYTEDMYTLIQISVSQVLLSTTRLCVMWSAHKPYYFSWEMHSS